ncbi:MAG: hypothetical protein QN161_12325, partial [Armatimonadota bacterium]|nr:hypothetical protein [Armatimonadota bacterium]
EEGLVAHPMAGVDPPRVQAALGVPEGFTVLLVVSLGFPGDPADLQPHHLELERTDRKRIPLEQVVAYNGWDPRLEDPA